MTEDASGTPGHHMAQDVLSGHPNRTRPHRATDSTPPHVLAAEYTRQMLPWARKLVCFGRDRSYRGDVRHLRHGARVG